MIQQALKTIRTLLPSDGVVSEEQIETVVNYTLAIPVYQNVDKDLLIREVQSTYNFIKQEEFSTIERRANPWVKDIRSSVEWRFWYRYRDYLETEKNFAPSVLSNVDQLTDRILDGLFNPSSNGNISKYGLVVGQVQSGKTSNYTGLICKAADAGFKLIIVLAGIHNNLRSQTQLRLDEGFLGFDTQYQRAFARNNIWVGTGKIDSGIVAHSLTSSLDRGDFSAGAANSLGINFNTNEPIIAVVKKNASVLNRLLIWLTAQSIDINGKKVIKNKSLLLVDDEADNASINTNSANNNVTRINGLIRDVIRLFEKSGYVGYTATPFANLFIPIEQDDLFPRDFIINLPAPNNYIGPDKVFGFKITPEEELSETLPIIRRISDYHNFAPERQSSLDPLPTEAPPSLHQAIKSFILTCAIRRLRGQTTAHNSMLIHVSRLVSWQKQIKLIVEEVFDHYRRGIEMNIALIIEELRLLYEVDTPGHLSYISTSKEILNSEFKAIDPYVQIHEWKEVLPFLHEAASRIVVKEIHGGSSDSLSYFDHPNGLSVIAVGGNKLSRGLTLEGLSVSYYLRTSRMYDTLMQMGRWFGYRHGYVDLCRLFTSRTLNEWFCHITLASEELREEFDYMSDIAGTTPEHYALRVRTHPGVLQISASNKIRGAQTVRVSWSGRLVETYELSRNPGVVNRNLKTTLELIEDLGTNFLNESNYYLWKNAEFTAVEKFLSNFTVYDNLKSASPVNILKFIRIKYSRNELRNWNIGVITKSRGKDFFINDSISVKLIERTPSKESEGDKYYINKSHIISPDDEFIDLSETEKGLARLNSKNPKRINGLWVRNNIRKPDRVLLLIYFLDPEKAGMDSAEEPIVGFAISFPSHDTDDAVSYAIPEQLLPLFNQEDDLYEEIYDDED